MTKQVEVIYQSRETEERAFVGIKKMLASAEIQIKYKACKVCFSFESEIWRISYAGYAFGHRKAYEEMS